eukprot:TRINITY_DN19880_c0_g1_i3.p2 TRINITY_DN19880_c0_g1~~TRINITY_DN19880_c0_g1_i3.p2  ORF type:complete len:124 (-),score=5.70 TRINITY_DN19880_c0_g1_i3:34-405(-)
MIRFRALSTSPSPVQVHKAHPRSLDIEPIEAEASLVCLDELLAGCLAVRNKALVAHFASLGAGTADPFPRIPQLGSRLGRCRCRCRVLFCLNHAGLLTTATTCLLYTSPSPRDRTRSRMPSSA